MLSLTNAASACPSSFWFLYMIDNCDNNEQIIETEHKCKDRQIGGYQLTDYLTKWGHAVQTDWPTVWLIERMIDWLNDRRLNEWMDENSVNKN